MRLANERLAIAERIGRADLQSGVLLELNDVYNARLETERAHEPLALAIELAGTSGSPTTRGWILRASGRQAALEGRLVDAEAALERGARDLHRERGGVDARPNAELARGRALGASATSTGRRRPCARRSACSSRSRTGERSSRASACWRRCCSTRGASRRRSASPSSRARPSAPGDVSSRLDDAARARARPGRPGQGRRGRAAAAGGRGDPAADRVPAPPDRAARGARGVPPRARPRRRGGRGGGGARRAPRRLHGRSPDDRLNLSPARDRLQPSSGLSRALRRGRGSP